MIQTLTMRKGEAVTVPGESFRRARQNPQNCGRWPRRAGWYEFRATNLIGQCRAELWFDFGLGLVRHHSVDLGASPACLDRWFIRLFKIPHEIELRVWNQNGIPGIEFEPVPGFQVIWEMLRELPGFFIASAIYAWGRGQHRRHHTRPVRRWRWRGLQAMREGEGSGSFGSYVLWRQRYSSNLLKNNGPLKFGRGWLLVVELGAPGAAINSRLILVRQALKLGFSVNLIIDHGFDVGALGEVTSASHVTITFVNAGEFLIARHMNDLLTDAQLRWLVFVPSYIQLAPDALPVFLGAASQKAAAIIYSDSECMDERRHCDPLLRHQFSPERLQSQDWLGPLLAINCDVARNAGGWRHEAGDHAAYDLCLRIAASVPGSRFLHIPQILYSESPKSTSVTASRQLDELRHIHIHDQGFSMEASASVAGLVTVIIATRDRLDLLKSAINSVLEVSSVRPGEILIVDNGSTDFSTLGWLAEIEIREPSVKVIRDPGEFNYSRLNNLAASQAKGSILAFLNNDTEVLSPDWIEICGALAMRPGVGAVGPLLLYPDGNIQHAGIITGAGGMAGHIFAGLTLHHCDWWELPLVTRNVSAVTGACLFLEKRKFELAGRFDEANLAVSLNDVDLCLRLEANSFRNVFVPEIKLVHKERQSRDRDSYQRNSRFSKEFDYMRARWGERLDRDPWCPAPLRIVGGVPELFWAPEHWEGFVDCEP